MAASSVPLPYQFLPLWGRSSRRKTTREATAGVPQDPGHCQGCVTQELNQDHHHHPGCNHTPKQQHTGPAICSPPPDSGPDNDSKDPTIVQGQGPKGGKKTPGGNTCPLVHICILLVFLCTITFLSYSKQPRSTSEQLHTKMVDFSEMQSYSIIKKSF